VKESERRIFIIEQAPSIRNVLSTLMPGAESNGDIAHSTLETLEKFGEGEGDKLVLDLRCAAILPGEVSPAIKNFQGSRLGRVLVVTGEVTDPQIFRQIEELRRPHFSSKHLTFSLRAFVHALF
jgi:CheY-like chemotaxis protein